jgi:hypothetical protein
VGVASVHGSRPGGRWFNRTWLGPRCDPLTLGQQPRQSPLPVWTQRQGLCQGQGAAQIPGAMLVEAGQGNTCLRLPACGQPLPDRHRLVPLADPPVECGQVQEAGVIQVSVVAGEDSQGQVKAALHSMEGGDGADLGPMASRIPVDGIKPWEEGRQGIEIQPVVP